MEEAETKKTKVRSLEIAFDQSSWGRIEELKRKAKLEGDNADLMLMRNALMVYEWYMDQISAGGEIGVVAKGRLTKHKLSFE